MYGIDAYKTFKKTTSIMMTKFLSQFFTIFLEQLEMMKKCTEAEDFIQRDIYHEKVQGWLMKFAQGFRDDNADDQQWAEVLTPLLIMSREQARAVRRGDFAEYASYCAMVRDLIRFWDEEYTKLSQASSLDSQTATEKNSGFEEASV